MFEFLGLGSAYANPLQIFEGDLLQWVRADLGVTIDTGVSVWEDQSGNGHDYAQGTGSKQPTLNATGLDGRPTILGDGSNDYLANTTLSPPAPGTTPTLCVIVFCLRAWANAKNAFGRNSGSGGHTFSTPPSGGASPQMGMNCGGASVVNVVSPTIDTWYRARILWTNSTADYIKLGSNSPVTGASAGNTAGSGRGLFGAANVTFLNVEIAELFYVQRASTTAEDGRMDAYLKSLYPSIQI